MPFLLMLGKCLRRVRNGAVMKPRLFVQLVVALAVFSFALGPAHAGGPNPVTVTKHANLGFSTSVPVTEDTGVANPPCLLNVVVCLFHGAIAFNGTLTAHVSLGTDVAMTYDSSDLNTPNGPLPVSVKYTPTPGGSTVSYSLSGTMTFNFDGCLDCPKTLPFNASSAPTTFTAPMGSDSPVTIPATSSGITLSVAGLKVITASLAGSLTLAPAGPGLLPGLGGAAAVVQATGASGAPALPIEWDSAGSTQAFTLTTPASPAPVGVSLSPLLHWVATSGNAQINLHWTDDFQSAVAVVADIVTAGVCVFADCSIGDPAPISLFSGGLGPVYSSAGLDTAIGNAVGGVAGPLVAGRVGAGFVPVPLTSPPLASIPPLSVGSLDFGVPSASITGAPAGVVLSGDSVSLSAAASGGTGPYTYAWTKDGVPFATTQTITDTPSLGDTTYAVTVTDSLGAVSNTATTVVHDYDFTVAGSPTSQQILTSGTNTYGVTESLVSGSASSGLPTIGLSLSGLPAGATASFAPASGSAGGFSSTLTITTAGAPPGTYSLTLTGTDGRALIGGTRSTSLTLTILTPAQAIPNVITTIQGLQTAGVLNGGQANSLIVKLNHAIDSLNSKPGKPPGCNQLQAFVNEVNAYVSAGTLTQAQADSLLGGPLGVLAIMASIPC
jgi:hypothetical protein